ncbi:MAG: DUF523 and DUF1722 domain-containing protein [Gammaproteobacteria bacterium]
MPREKSDISRTRIKIGISSCLMGNPVRYNGGHRRDPYITTVLSGYFEFIPFCPEVAIGLDIPRPIIRLEGSAEAPHAVMPDAGNRDVTAELHDYAREIGNTWTDISGYILKSRSPSCGMQGINIYDEDGNPAATGAGIYADTLMKCRPLLPVEDERRLRETARRDSFFKRIFVYHSWQRLLAEGITEKKLTLFHKEQRFLNIASDQILISTLERLITGSQGNIERSAAIYMERLMKNLNDPVKHRVQTGILQKIAGSLRPVLENRDRTVLDEAIAGYRKNHLPLIVPLTLVHHHLHSNREILATG